ncbi:hypothetical protein HPB50_029279 [Hyalomma asiaticum]|nr:hypothetical protein HPB50_029279 [Hyalomma asiaticum]
MFPMSPNNACSFFFLQRRYFYSGRLEAETAFQAACTRTAAAKYLLPQLEMKCRTFINSNMTPSDVCPFLDYVFTTGEEALATSATITIVEESRNVLSSKTFRYCTEATMKYVLKHAANLSEAIVLEAVYAWSQEYAVHTQELRVDLRAVMLPLLPELRFLALTSQQFVDGPNAWGILTDAEARAILSNIVRNGSMPMPAHVSPKEAVRLWRAFLEFFREKGPGRHSAQVHDLSNAEIKCLKKNGIHYLRHMFEALYVYLIHR